MVYFILKRMAQSIFVMLAVAFLAFSLFRFVGDPITQMTGVETSVADQERLREELGLNDPFVYQYIRFTGDMLQGDFGFSYRTRQPVADMIADRFPATLELGVVALIISLLVGQKYVISKRYFKQETIAFGHNFINKPFDNRRR